jgi:hypothetical protein
LSITYSGITARRAAASARRSRPECAWRSFLSSQAAETLVELGHLAERVSVIRIGWGEELWGVALWAEELDRPLGRLDHRGGPGEGAKHVRGRLLAAVRAQETKETLVDLLTPSRKGCPRTLVTVDPHGASGKHA